MRNEDTFKTAEERCHAYYEYAQKNGRVRSVEDFAYWLAIEAEEEKPEPCFYCGSECEAVDGSKYKPDRHGIRPYNYVRCKMCYYASNSYETVDEAIAAHNRVARAVENYKTKKEA